MYIIIYNIIFATISKTSFRRFVVYSNMLPISYNIASVKI